MSLQTNTEGSNEEFVAARVYNLLIAANASFLPNLLTSKSHRWCLGMRLGSGEERWKLSPKTKEY